MLRVSVWAAVLAIVGHDALAQPSPNPVVHHDLAVKFDAANHRLKVRDLIRIPGALVTAPFTISLNGDLELEAVPGGLKLLAGGPPPGSDSGLSPNDHDSGGSRIPVALYSVEGAVPGQELTGEIDYEGSANHQASSNQEASILRARLVGCRRSGML
jgi:hypothetical protein